ncbi:alpha/beta hydrolase [Weissella uvarum]|uniref:alpha/beta fold hydrolase n=1 Tax=Weissella uvarum TaxID=1479233 RepID=UPI0030B8C1B3
MFSSGYSGNFATWQLQIPYFIEQGYRVLTWDYRGHGDSDRVNYGLRIARLAQDLHELINNLQIKQYVLIGHSMGTMVDYAYTSLFNNDNILAIVSEDQPPKMIPDENWPYGRYDLNYANLVQMAMDFPKTPLIRQPLTSEQKRRISHPTPKFDFNENLPLLLDGMGQNFLDVETHEQMPHLFLAGAASPLYDAKQAEAAKALQPNMASQAVVFPDVGHIPHLEASESFNQVVVDFLDRVLAK